MQAVHPGYRRIQLRPIHRPVARATRLSPAVYRRRRLVVALCVASVVFVGWFGARQLTGVSGGGPLPAAGQPVSAINATLATEVTAIVQPGDTLWTLARRAQPTGDVRPLVQALEAQRHGQALQVGEHIVVSVRK